MSEINTERVIFRGRVQGVGFRSWVRSIAKRHPVKGYVKNLADGTVELVMQGPVAARNGLMAAVTNYFRGNITNCDRREIETTDEFPAEDFPVEDFTVFEIRF